MSGFQAVILAAGEGLRMKSKTPKLLHELCGKPLVDWTLDACAAAGAAKPVIVLSDAVGPVADYVRGRAVIAVQNLQAGKGTGAATAAAMPCVDMRGGPVVVLAVDQPLVSQGTIAGLVAAIQEGADAALATAHLADPAGYGRVLRDGQGAFVALREDKDCTDEQRAVREVNVSFYAFAPAALERALPALTTNNAQGEYYLTDVYAVLREQRARIDIIPIADADEGLGVNDRAQLSLACAAMRSRINRAHMLAGVTLVDPAAVYIDEGVSIGEDTVVHPNCTLQKGTVIGRGCTLLPGCRLENTVLHDGVSVESSVLVQAEVGEGTKVGPFAYLRPHAVVGRGCRVGDFVEVKNASIADGAKVSHLAYVGDADIGARVNLGCGVVTGNYDGKKKNRTVVKDGAFIGCNTNLVAPITVGEDAYVAAGSTLTQDVPPGALAVARGRQVTKEGWVARRKAEGLL